MAEGTEPWVLLREALEKGQIDDASTLIDALSAGDLARAVSHLPAEVQAQLLERVDAEAAADVLERLSRTQAVELVQQLEPARAAEILQELPLEAEVDIVRDLEEEDAADVLAAMPAEEADEVREVARWDDDVAGGLMGVEFLAVKGSLTMREVIDQLREGAGEFEEYDVQYVYVVDDREHLEGVLPLRTVVLSKPGAKARDVMIGDPLKVEAKTDLDALEDMFDDIDFFALPVVDEGRLVGVLRRGAVLEAVGEQAAVDHLRSAGIVDGDELRSMALWDRARGRLKWLSLNVGLNVVAASVIAMFQETLQTVVALAVFLPIISDMSGCSGNQAVAVSMRELSLGIAQPRDVLYVWGKELAVGLLNGTALGGLLGIVAFVWMGNPWLGLVAGGALALNTLVAVSVGGTVPLLATRFGFDPALASGPMLTTITDVCGFALALGMATALLPYLAA
ncbi:MAG: magnesium transporter [Alphaproteobacteria bacterium]|nr:magnesium transporter [Alphaproteobacteria bacterium]